MKHCPTISYDYASESVIDDTDDIHPAALPSLVQAALLLPFNADNRTHSK